MNLSASSYAGSVPGAMGCFHDDLDEDDKDDDDDDGAPPAPLATLASPRPAACRGHGPAAKACRRASVDVASRSILLGVSAQLGSAQQ